MKKLIIPFAAVLFFASGCLKDQVDQPNMDNGSSPDAVMFTQATVSEGISADATPQTVSNIYVGLNSNGRQSSDVTSTISSNPALVPAAYTALPAGSFTFTSSSVIKAGQLVDTISITVLDASALDPNIKYAVVLTIESTQSGFQVASNSKTVLVTFSIKNKYDGTYSLRGIHNRSPYNFPYSGIEVDLVTSGPNSVVIYWDGELGVPIGTGPGAVGGYGAGIAPEIVFDPSSNAVIGVNNATPGTPLFLGPNPGRYDPVTKTIYFQFYYTTGANQDFSNRGWSDTLTYLHAR